MGLMSHIFISWVCLKCCDYRKCTSNGEALQLHKVYFTASHVRIHITYCESCAQYLNMQWVCIRNHYTMCTENSCLLLLALLLMLCTHIQYKDTDGNKLVMFSAIALYYGDTFIPTCIEK